MNWIQGQHANQHQIESISNRIKHFFSWGLSNNVSFNQTNLPNGSKDQRPFLEPTGPTIKPPTTNLPNLSSYFSSICRATSLAFPASSRLCSNSIQFVTVFFGYGYGSRSRSRFLVHREEQCRYGNKAIPSSYLYPLPLDPLCSLLFNHLLICSFYSSCDLAAKRLRVIRV